MARRRSLPARCLRDPRERVGPRAVPFKSGGDRLGAWGHTLLSVVVWAAIVAVVGALMSAAGGAWLFFGFKAGNPRYRYDDTNLRFGPQRAEALTNLLHDQQKVTGLVFTGGAVQLVGTVLALVAAMQS